jgi:L-amino acid N-acyltransferase YncA
MSKSMAELLTRYPKKLPDGLQIRPLQPSDRESLGRFFRRLPLEERRLLKEDITDPAIVERFIRELNYEVVLPLVVVEGDRIVADATLHRDQRGWARHVARVRVTLDPEFRTRGLGRALIRELIELSRPLGIALLDAEVLSPQKDAIRLFEALEFECTATLQMHAFDQSGRPHDVLLFTYVVTPPERLMPGAQLREEETDVGGG